MNPDRRRQARHSRIASALLVGLLIWSSAAAAISNCPCPADERADERADEPREVLKTTTAVPDCHQKTPAVPQDSNTLTTQGCCPELALTPSRPRLEAPLDVDADDSPLLAIIEAPFWPRGETLTTRTTFDPDPPPSSPHVRTHILFCCFRE